MRDPHGRRARRNRQPQPQPELDAHNEFEVDTEPDPIREAVEQEEVERLARGAVTSLADPEE